MTFDIRGGALGENSMKNAWERLEKTRANHIAFDL